MAPSLHHRHAGRGLAMTTPARIDPFADPPTPSGTPLGRYGTELCPYLQRLVIPDRGVRRIVPVTEVDWIEGETYYVRVHAHGRGRLLRERLGALEAALDPAHFFRTHRSAIVRL